MKSTKANKQVCDFCGKPVTDKVRLPNIIWRRISKTKNHSVQACIPCIYHQLRKKKVYLFWDAAEHDYPIDTQSAVVKFVYSTQKTLEKLLDKLNDRSRTLFVAELHDAFDKTANEHLSSGEARFRNHLRRSERDINDAIEKLSDILVEAEQIIYEVEMKPVEEIKDSHESKDAF
jgi:hypothetical protein